MFGVALLITLIFLSKKLIQLKSFQRLVLVLIFAFTSFFIYNKTDVSEKFTRLSKIEWDIDSIELNDKNIEAIFPKLFEKEELDKFRNLQKGILYKKNIKLYYLKFNL